MSNQLIMFLLPGLRKILPRVDMWAEKNRFDIIYGTGILHHLNLKACLDEIERILKPGGKFVFIEPLGTNPVINLYRK